MKLIPETMAGVHLTGHGGLEKLVYREDIPTPRPRPGQVLVNVTAAGMNNTDINTRTGWYNQAVTSGTTADSGRRGFGVKDQGMGDWIGGLTFPRIQGVDAVGRVVAVGEGVDPARVGERVVCNPCICDASDDEDLEHSRFLGSELDGAFAQFIVISSRNAVAVDTALPVDDTALATLPCSGGTAMNMLLLAKAKAGDLVLVTGASGGVGTFLVQIAKHLGAEVVAIAGRTKMKPIKALGADVVIERGVANLRQAVVEATGGRRLSLVADVVGGELFPSYLSMLRRGGRYVTAGAIAGPLVELDLRTLYLKNLQFYGSTVFCHNTFPTLMGIVAASGVTPVVARTFPLSEIRAAQSEFLEKNHVGSMVLLPPAV